MMYLMLQLIATIESTQCTIIQGMTGCGKTTQVCYISYRFITLFDLMNFSSRLENTKITNALNAYQAV